MTHPLLRNLHYLADSTDPAHLAKLKTEMEAAAKAEAEASAEARAETEALAEAETEARAASEAAKATRASTTAKVNAHLAADRLAADARARFLVRVDAEYRARDVHTKAIRKAESAKAAYDAAMASAK